MTMGQPPLTVLVGAGGSIDLGVPSTSQLTTGVLDHLCDNWGCLARVGGDGLNRDAAWDRGKELAARLSQRMRDYYGNRFNFECLLNALELLETMEDSHARGKGAESLLLEPCAWAREFLDSSFPGSAADQLHRAIHAAVTKASGSIQSHPRWSAFKGFWRTLADRSESRGGHA